MAWLGWQLARYEVLKCCYTGAVITEQRMVIERCEDAENIVNTVLLLLVQPPEYIRRNELADQGNLTTINVSSRDAHGYVAIIGRSYSSKIYISSLSGFLITIFD